jgi:hypothetical protein
MRNGLGRNPLLYISEFFSCDAYVHVPKEKRSKLDNKVEKCIFIDDKDSVKCYKIWNPIIRKIVYNHDMIFKEVKSTPKHEYEPREGEPDKIVFELENGEFDSVDEDESDELDEEEEP